MDRVVERDRPVVDEPVADEENPEVTAEDAARIAGYTIRDRESFEAVTNRSREIAGLYAYMQLDGLIELAILVAHDFFARPYLYTKLGDFDIATELARLRTRPGTDERYFSRDQREAIFLPLFGDERPGGPSDFASGRDALLNAAAVFAEWSQTTGIPSLRASVRTHHYSFKVYLRTLAGASVAWSRQKALPVLADDAAYLVLRDKGIVGVFSQNAAPPESWPYREDPNGSKVIQEIGQKLGGDAAPAWTTQRFTARQRVAFRGAEALASVLDFDEDHGSDDDLDTLISRCYTWHTALQACAKQGAPIMASNASGPQQSNALMHASVQYG